jgi:hypothetical protein
MPQGVIKKMKINNLPEVLEFFPEVEPPVIISPEEVLIYSRENKPFSQAIIKAFILQLEETEPDMSVVEFIPCFRFSIFKDQIALVYYRADLYQNEFMLVILNTAGTFIDKKGIAGTMINNNQLVSSVASIDEDGLIQVVVGTADGRLGSDYDPSRSRFINYEIAPDGRIILSNNIKYDEI